MEIPLLTDCTTVGVFAPVSSGKTWLLHKWVNAMERSCTLDTTAECMAEDYTHIWANPKQLAERLRDNPTYYRIAYHPGPNIIEDFNWLTVSMWNVPNPRWLVIDEVHEVCSINSVPERMNMLLRYSRHVLLGVIGASQRIADVDKLFTANCRMVVLFNTVEARDHIAISDRWGKEVDEQVKALRPLIYDDATKTVHQEPECLVWVRGRGTKVFALGDKIKTTQEKDTWVNNGKEPPKTPDQPSLARPSGSPEPRSQEPTSDRG